MDLAGSVQKCLMIAPHPRRRSIIRAPRASIAAQVIVWGLAENAMNGAANTDLLNRPAVGLGVGEALAGVDPLSFFDKFPVTHGASLCLGSISAFTALSPSQVIRRHLRK